jgi:hypothetical protein
MEFALEAFTVFDFLMTEHGFHLVMLEPHVVRFEGPHTFLEVSFFREDGDIGCQLGWLSPGESQPEEAFSMEHIQSLAGLRASGRYVPFQASSRPQAIMLLPLLGRYIKAYAGPVLAGDPETLHELRRIRAEQAEVLRRHHQLAPIRADAERAWHTKDFAQLVKLFEPIQGDLTPAERKKLEYCRKRCG